MNFKGPELVVDAVVAKLQANLPTRIASINTEYGDVPLDVLDNSRYYTTGMRLYPPGGAIVVFDGRTSRAPGAEGVHQVMTSMRLAVYTILDDADEQNLDRKLKRMNRAVIEALLDDAPKEQLFDPADGTTIAAWRIAFQETQPSPVFQPEGDGATLRASRLTIFTITRLEQ